eukprot:scaffold133201_cov34-Tisochrysis_lutea.AAC.3
MAQEEGVEEAAGDRIHAACHWPLKAPHTQRPRARGDVPQGRWRGDKGSGRGCSEATQGRARDEIVKKFFFHMCPSSTTLPFTASSQSDVSSLAEPLLRQIPGQYKARGLPKNSTT